MVLYVQHPDIWNAYMVRAETFITPGLCVFFASQVHVQLYMCNFVEFPAIFQYLINMM